MYTPKIITTTDDKGEVIHSFSHSIFIMCLFAYSLFVYNVNVCVFFCVFFIGQRQSSSPSLCKVQEIQERCFDMQLFCCVGVHCHSFVWIFSHFVSICIQYISIIVMLIIQYL